MPPIPTPPSSVYSRTPTHPLAYLPTHLPTYSPTLFYLLTYRTEPPSPLFMVPPFYSIPSVFHMFPFCVLVTLHIISHHISILYFPLFFFSSFPLFFFLFPFVFLFLFSFVFPWCLCVPCPPCLYSRTRMTDELGLGIWCLVCMYVFLPFFLFFSFLSSLFSGYLVCCLTVSYFILPKLFF